MPDDEEFEDDEPPFSGNEDFEEEDNVRMSETQEFENEDERSSAAPSGGPAAAAAVDPSTAYALSAAATAIAAAMSTPRRGVSEEFEEDDAPPVPPARRPEAAKLQQLLERQDREEEERQAAAAKSAPPPLPQDGDGDAYSVEQAGSEASTGGFASYGALLSVEAALHGGPEGSPPSPRQPQRRPGSAGPSSVGAGSGPKAPSAVQPPPQAERLNPDLPSPPAHPRSGAALGGPEWKQKLQAQMHGRIQQVIKQRTGPSFEERVAKAAANFRVQAKAVEEKQRQHIEQALARARERPMESAPRPRELQPPSIEEHARTHAKIRRENEARYAQQAAERKQRMDTREPLFRVSEVNAAFEMQRQRQEERKRQLREEEQQRWVHIRELQERVLERPLLVEDYKRPEHLRSTTPDLRLVPEHTKATPLQQKITKSVSQQWFLDSAWGKEVQSLRERMDARPKLHEIPYPPKKYPEKPVPPKVLAPIDIMMQAAINQPWYQKSQWAEQVREIRQRQDERPKLHELSYPPKR